MRRGALLDLLLKNKEELIGDVKAITSNNYHFWNNTITTQSLPPPSQTETHHRSFLPYLTQASHLQIRWIVSGNAFFILWIFYFLFLEEGEINSKKCDNSKFNLLSRSSYVRNIFSVIQTQSHSPSHTCHIARPALVASLVRWFSWVQGMWYSI